MDKPYFLVPINCAHSLLTKIKLNQQARFDLIDGVRVQDRFNKSMNYGFSSKDFIFSKCNDVTDGWKNLVIIYEKDADDFGEYLNNANKYIQEILLKIRLFTSSDIYANDMFLFCYMDGMPICTGHNIVGTLSKYGSIRDLEITEEKINQLQEFIDGFSIQKCSIKLREAITIFNQSFSVLDFGIRFVLLMVAIEMLFGFNIKEEVRYRVSRNAAIFLSKDIGEYRENFPKLRKFYDNRSTFVHTGDKDDINIQSLIELQDTVCRVLLKYITVEKTMKITQDLLSESGFGFEFD